MWRLILAQLRYSRFWLIVGFVFLAGVAVSVALVAKDPKVVAKLQGMTFPVGLFLGIYLWYRDLKERRALVWLDLPVDPIAWLGVRLWIPALLVVGLQLVELLGWLVRALRFGDLPLTDWLAMTLSSKALVLAILLFFPFSEEINIYLRRHRWALYLFNFGVAGAALVVAFFVDLDIDEPLVPGLIACGVALVTTLASWWAYRRRTSYLVVSHPVHGLPQDLASSEGQFSTR